MAHAWDVPGADGYAEVSALVNSLEESMSDRGPGCRDSRPSIQQKKKWSLKHQYDGEDYLTTVDDEDANVEEELLIIGTVEREGLGSHGGSDLEGTSAEAHGDGSEVEIP